MTKVSEQNLPLVRQLPETEHWLSLHCNTANLCWIAPLPQGSAVMQMQGFRCSPLRPFKMYCHSLQNSVLSGIVAELRLCQAGY